MTHLLKTIQFLYIFLIYILLPLNPLMAFEFRDYVLLDMLVKSCHKDIQSCNEALLKTNKYQKKAGLNQKFSCQTRLLGLEANIIMAMNSNLKRNEAKSIVQAVKNFC